MRTTAANRRAAAERAETVTADPVPDGGASVGVGVAGLALAAPLGVERAAEAVSTEPVVQALRRRASASNALIGGAGRELGALGTPHRSARANPVDALRRQAATVTGRQSRAETGRQPTAGAITIRRTLQDAIQWGAQQEPRLAFTSDDEVVHQIEEWDEAGDAASMDKRDELGVRYWANHSDLPAAAPDVVQFMATDLSDDSSDGESTYVTEDEVGPASAAPKKTLKKKPGGGSASHTAGPGNPTFSTTKAHKKKGGSMQFRPAAYGSVDIDHESIEHVTHGRINRPVSASGLIAPMDTTGRGAAPEPASGLAISQGARPTFHWRNTGMIDVDKGHMIALELGGPDVPENITAQFSLWQQSGEWRRAEVNALRLATELEGQGKKAEYSVDLHYKPYKVPEQGTVKGLTFASSFKIELREVNPKTGEKGSWTTLLDAPNCQSERQLQRGNKTIDEADEVLAGDEESVAPSDDESQPDMGD